jgi:hypothetical protein
MPDEIIKPMLATSKPPPHFADAVLQARLAALADPEGKRLEALSGLAFLPEHVVPCSECGDFGSIQPCDGLRAQPASEPRKVVSQLDMAKMFA